MANSNSGTRRSTSARTASSPWARRRSHGSRPVGSTATNVRATNRWSSVNARSAAFCPAASPSKVKTTSPRMKSSSMSSRRSTLMCSAPKDVPQVAIAVVDSGEVARHDVGVALDDDRPLLLAPPRAWRGRGRRGPGSSCRSGVSGVLRYFGPSSVVVELAGAEADDVAGQVADRPDAGGRGSGRRRRGLPWTTSPPASSSSSAKPLPRRCRVRLSQPCGA